MSAARWAESICLQLPLRLGLGGLFALAAWKKLHDVQSFADAIKGFRVFDVSTHEHLIVSGAFTIPWVEMIAAVLLVFGLWTRAAALTIGLMLLMFIAALLHVIFDESISVDCSCFGDLSVVCPAAVGWCQVLRNLVLLLPAGYLVWRGGGAVTLDALCGASKASKGSKGNNHAGGLDEGVVRG